MRSRRLLYGGLETGIGTRESFWPSRVNLTGCACRAYKINLIGIPSLRGCVSVCSRILSCHETVATEEAPGWFEAMESERGTLLDAFHGGRKTNHLRSGSGSRPEKAELRWCVTDGEDDACRIDLGRPRDGCFLIWTEDSCENGRVARN